MNNVSGHSKKQYYHRGKHASEHNINIDKFINTESSCPEAIDKNNEMERSKFQSQQSNSSNKVTDEGTNDIFTKSGKSNLLKDLK